MEVGCGKVEGGKGEVGVRKGEVRGRLEGKMESLV